MRKKTFKVLSILVIMAIVIMPTVQAASKKQIGEKISFYGILGDVNRDGKINSEDSRLILAYSTGTKKLTIFQKRRADVNQDGKINSQDAILILNYSTGTNQNNKVNVSSISITGATEAYEGDKIKLNVKIEPNDATDKEVKWSTSSSYRATVDQDGNVTAKNSGTVNITAAAGGKSATHKIEIKGRKTEVTKIDIIKNPTKMEYNLNENLDTTGLTIRVTYNDGKTEEITTGFSVTPNQLTKIGKQKVTVTYSEKTATYDVNVGKLSNISSAEISNNESWFTIENSTNTTNPYVKNNGYLSLKLNGIYTNKIPKTVHKNDSSYKYSGAIACYYVDYIKGKNPQVSNINGKYSTDSGTSFSSIGYKYNDTFNTYNKWINEIYNQITKGNPVILKVRNSSSEECYVVAYAIKYYNSRENGNKLKASEIRVIDTLTGEDCSLGDFYEFKTNNNYVMAYKKESSITMKQEETVLIYKETRKMPATTTTEDKKITYSSNNNSVATVNSSGEIVAKGVGNAIISAKNSKGDVATCKVKVISETTKVAIPTNIGKGYKYFYNQLSTREKQIYRYLYSRLPDFLEGNTINLKPLEKTVGAFYNYTDKNPYAFGALSYLWSAKSALFLDDPTMNYAINSCKYILHDEIEDKNKYDLFEPANNKISLISDFNKINTIVNDIVYEAEKKTTDYEKIKYVHDAIAKNNKFYHGEDINEIGAKMLDSFLTKKAVCANYAAMFKYVLNRLNIDCISVTGTVNDWAHAWNYVQLDNKWYLVDITWDDFDYTIDGVEDSRIYYEYFMIGSETNNRLRKTELNNAYNYPELSKTDYNN